MNENRLPNSAIEKLATLYVERNLAPNAEIEEYGKLYAQARAKLSKMWFNLDSGELVPPKDGSVRVLK